MDLSIITAVIAATAAVSGIFIGWSGRNRTLRQETKQEAAAGAELRADLAYIKRGVEDIRLDQRAHGQKIEQLNERVTRLEERIRKEEDVR